MMKNLLFHIALSLSLFASNMFNMRDALFHSLSIWSISPMFISAFKVLTHSVVSSILIKNSLSNMEGFCSSNHFPNNNDNGTGDDSSNDSLQCSDPLYGCYVKLFNSINLSDLPNKKLALDYMSFFLSSISPLSEEQECLSEEDLSSSISSLLLFKFFIITSYFYKDYYSMKKVSPSDMAFLYLELSYYHLGDEHMLGSLKEEFKEELIGLSPSSEKKLDYPVNSYFKAPAQFGHSGDMLPMLLDNFSPESFCLTYSDYTDGKVKSLDSSKLDPFLDFMMDNSFEEDIMNLGGFGITSKVQKGLEETLNLKGGSNSGILPMSMYTGFSCNYVFFQDSKILREHFMTLISQEKNMKTSWDYEMNWDVELYVENSIGKYESVCVLSDYVFSGVLQSMGMRVYDDLREYAEDCWEAFSYSIHFHVGFMTLEYEGRHFSLVKDKILDKVSPGSIKLVVVSDDDESPYFLSKQKMGEYVLRDKDSGCVATYNKGKKGARMKGTLECMGDENTCPFKNSGILTGEKKMKKVLENMGMVFWALEKELKEELEEELEEE